MPQPVLAECGDAAAQCRAYAAAELGGLDDEVVADALLVITELVTNAQLHGTPPVLVSVTKNGDGARVQVADAGRRPLVLPAHSTDSMTGRGLSMVAAVALAWGVDQGPDGGKVVWAELGAGGGAQAELADVELDALLAAWEDELGEAVFTVRLGAVPTSLLLDAKRHIDNVVRELTLERAGASAPLPAELETLIDTVTGDFARARTGLKEQAAAAAARGDINTHLVLKLPASSIAAGERYLAALDEVDQYAREARILTLETPSVHRLFRRWYVTALIDQLRACAQGTAPQAPLPFVELLVREVEDLSALRETAHRLDLLQRMNAALAEAQTVEGLARTVISAAVRELGAVIARVYVAVGDRLEATGQSAAPVAGSPGFELVRIDADLPASVVFRTGKPMVLRSLRQLVERFPHLAGVFDSERALHIVPLAVGGHQLGVVALGFAPGSQYDEAAQTRYVRALADVLAQGLERIAASDELSGLQRRSNRSASLTAGVTAGALADLASATNGAIAEGRSVESLLAVVTEAARSMLGTHQAAASRLYLGSWDGAISHVSLSEDYAQWADYDVVPQGLGVVNAITRENRPLRLTARQLSEHPEYRGLRDAPGHPPLPSYLAVPLLGRDGRNIGLIQLSDKCDGTEFDDADEATAVQLALMVSAALEHVEATTALEQTLDRLRDEQEIVGALHDVGRAVTSRLEHAEVVQIVTDAATTLTGAQFGAFFYNVVGDSGESYSLYTISGVPREAFSRFPMPRNTEIFAPTFEGHGVVRIDDVLADPRYGKLGPHHGMPSGHLPVRSYLAVPVRLAGGEVIGGLFFGHADPAVFDAGAERLAVEIAGYAAIALENGRRYDAARRESRTEREVAAALEQPLAPPELPLIPHVELGALFQPLGGGTALAGDFYDVFPLGGGRWMLALGDVSGKGPEAAVVTGLVRYTLWGAAQYAPDPAAVAAAVNAALLRQHSGRFATLVIAVLTPTESGLAVDAVWGGHPPAVLLRDDDATLIAGIGLPVGMFAEFKVEPVRFTVLPGETLLLYTDGLLERRGAVLEERTLVELVRRHAKLPVGELLSAVVADIDARHPARDDVAAVALRPAAKAPRA